MSGLDVICEQRDPSGDVCRIEHDPRDGRVYLTVVSDGHEAPFELTPDTAGRIAATLRAYAAPVDLSALRFTSGEVEPVKQPSPAVKQATAGGAP